ncbi:hypothetical protein [Rhizobium ruizarguesonis]|uniref:hypothetical protein n=1 Tax=Rhizobium ruizarguesonis TaxID=2081791 RepID=UPI0013EEBE45|nr:hypothetical protein [Rhizobium ruizarguesonis]
MSFIEVREATKDHRESQTDPAIVPPQNSAQSCLYNKRMAKNEIAGFPCCGPLCDSDAGPSPSLRAV